MVIPYRNKFIKVFLSSLAPLVVITVFIISIYNLTTSDSVEPDRDYLSFIIVFSKYILPIIVFIAYGLYVWSHYLLAKAKGYSGWLILLALIPTFGLAIIALLPDRRKMG